MSLLNCDPKCCHREETKENIDKMTFKYLSFNNEVYCCPFCMLRRNIEISYFGNDHKTLNNYPFGHVKIENKGNK